MDGPSERLQWEYNRLVDPATGKIPTNIREKELEFAVTLNKNASNKANALEPLFWTNRGPINLGGRTRALAIDVSSEDVILAGAVSGGMWKSINGGTSWYKTTSPEIQQSVTCIAQNTRPEKRNIWYYGSGEGYGSSASGDGAFFMGSGMYKSIDNGETWTSITSTASNTPTTFDNIWDVIWNIATDASNETQDEVYAATYGAIWRSVNGGTNWAAVRGSASGDAYATDVAVTPSGVVYATVSSDGTGKGIWRSIDGTTWTSIIPPSFPTTYNRIVIGIDPNNENNVWFLGETPGGGKTTTNYQGDPEQNSLWKYTYITGNGSGADGSWTNLSANLPQNGTEFDNFNSQGGYDLLVRVSPFNSNHVIIGGTNLFFSTDGFATMNNTKQIGGYGIGTSIPIFTSYPNHHPDQHNLIFSKTNSNVVYSSSDGGVKKTSNLFDNSVTWTSLNNGYYSSQFYTLAVDQYTSSDIVLAGAQDNGTQFVNSYSKSKPWVMSENGDGSFCAIAKNAKYFYTSRQQGIVVKSNIDINTGQLISYTRIDPAAAITEDYDFINPFTLDANDDNIMYIAGGKQIFRCNNLAQFSIDNTWNKKTTGWDALTNTFDAARKITALASSKGDIKRLYYGTNNQRVYKIDNPESGNPTPVNITSALFPVNATVSSIAVDPENADRLLVCFSNYAVYSLFLSEDGGTTFTKVAGNLEQNITTGAGNGPSFRGATILPLSDGTRVYFVATSIGVFATDNLSGTATIWEQQSPTQIGNLVCSTILSRPTDGLVLVGTHGNGIYSTRYPIGLSAKNKAENSVKKIVVYPNPANNFIKITIPENIVNSVGNINILNTNGKLVYNEKEKLNQNKMISTSDLRNGNYFLLIETNGTKYSQQFIINHHEKN